MGSIGQSEPGPVLDPYWRSSFLAARLAERHSSSYHGSDCRTRYVVVVTGIRSSSIVDTSWLFCDAISSTSRSVPDKSLVQRDDKRRALRNSATWRFFHSWCSDVTVSVTIYVLVTTTDNYLESLLTLTTLASSPECSTLTHINCLLLSFTLTFIVCIVYVAICQLF